MHPVFPFGHDKVSLGGPERHFFDVLGAFCRDLSLSRLQKIVASWRPQYPLMYAAFSRRPIDGDTPLITLHRAAAVAGGLSSARSKSLLPLRLYPE